MAWELFIVESKSTEELIMPIVRLIFVRVVSEEAKNAEQIWKESCAPLMIQQPGCLSEKLLRSSDDPGEFISYSEWKDQLRVEGSTKYRCLRDQ